jgi:hypothetical protein
MGVPEAQAEAGADLARETMMGLADKLATRDNLESVRVRLEHKIDQKVDSLRAELRADVRVTRVMVWFLGLIVIGTWGALAMPLLTSVRVG